MLNCVGFDMRGEVVADAMQLKEFLATDQIKYPAVIIEQSEGEFKEVSYEQH